MRKQTEQKDDGRYIIFYEFERDEVKGREDPSFEGSSSESESQ